MQYKSCVTVYAYQVFCKACWAGDGSTFCPSPPPLPPPPPHPQRSCFPHPNENHHQLQSSAVAGSLRGPWPVEGTGYDISRSKAWCFIKCPGGARGCEAGRYFHFFTVHAFCTVQVLGHHYICWFSNGITMVCQHYESDGRMSPRGFQRWRACPGFCQW